MLIVLSAEYDYEVKYPPDERYHELGENARVWRVYLDEAGEYDRDMIGQATDSLDVHLVFVRVA